MSILGVGNKVIQPVIPRIIKTFEKTMPNGNSQLRKVSKNGAVMEKITRPDGKLESIKVTLIDGALRKTKYDTNGIRLKTFTNTQGDVLIKYNSSGEAVSLKNINKKEIKPKLIREEIGDFGILKKIYSDGSYDTVDKFKEDSLITTKVSHYNSSDNLTSSVSETQSTIDGFKIILKRLYNDNGEHLSSISTSSNGYKHQTEYKNGDIIRQKTLFKDGFTRKISAVTAEQEVSTNKVEIIYPKNHLIEKSLIENKYEMLQETMYLKNGGKAILKVDKYYKPFELKIISKDTDNIIKNQTEIENWLAATGKKQHTGKKDHFHFEDTIEAWYFDNRFRD